MIEMMTVIIKDKEEQRRVDRYEVNGIYSKAIPKLRHNEEILETMDNKTIIIKI